MKKDELIHAILNHAATCAHSKTALNQMNKSQLEEVLREMDARAAAAPGKTESDGSDLLGGETSEGASSAPSEAGTMDAGPVSTDPVPDPVVGEGDGDSAPSEPQPMKVIGKHPVTGKPVYHVVD